MTRHHASGPLLAVALLATSLAPIAHATCPDNVADCPKEIHIPLPSSVPPDGSSSGNVSANVTVDVGAANYTLSATMSMDGGASAAEPGAHGKVTVTLLAGDGAKSADILIDLYQAVKPVGIIWDPGVNETYAFHFDPAKASSTGTFGFKVNSKLGPGIVVPIRLSVADVDGTHEGVGFLPMEAATHEPSLLMRIIWPAVFGLVGLLIGLAVGRRK